MLFFLRKIRRKLMEKNKVTTYLLYAIGEIVLVVIGILIAINLNNWNDKKKEAAIVQNNLTALLENLEKDSIYLIEAYARIAVDLENQLKFKKRINSIDATQDTLKKIARYEFIPNVITPQFTNDNHYYSMVQTGEINLIKKSLRREIFRLYRLHEEVTRSSETHFEIYLQATSSFQKSAALNSPVSLLREGPITNAVWDRLSLELAGDFNALFSNKMLLYLQMNRFEQELTSQTYQLLQLLRSELHSK